MSIQTINEKELGTLTSDLKKYINNVTSKLMEKAKLIEKYGFNFYTCSKAIKKQWTKK